MKVGDLVRYHDWHRGLIGKVITIDTSFPQTFQVAWFLGYGCEIHSPTFEWEKHLVVI